MNSSLFEVATRHGITSQDYCLAQTYVGKLRTAMVLAPDGEPYLYRWNLVPRNKVANVYFHIQVASDPERPEHDHPWDNTSAYLVGGCCELQNGVRHYRIPGDVVFRKAEQAHRLILPEGVPYTMTLFTTGPHRREWGFWYPHGWVHNKEVVRTVNGVSIHEELKA